MGSMMARSTPPVLFFSRHVRRGATVLEILAAMCAITLFWTVFALHVRFVRRHGCAAALDKWDFSDNDKNHPVLPPVLEIAVVSHRGPTVGTFRFSRERGLLLLSNHSLAALNVTVDDVRLSTRDPCFGDGVSQWILERIVGYETVAINAFARMKGITMPYGYVLSMQSRRVLNLMHADPGLGTRGRPLASRLALKLMWKMGAFLTAGFIMCTTAALVSFTLKEVQMRMIKLTMDLQVIMRTELGYGRVIFRYAMDALVFIPIIAGMLFFLFEFFDDQALAFSVLMLTWLCEFAASGSTRHRISRYYLPRLFFAYFGAFHVYFFSFPLGFSWLALITSVVFMLHAALAVWNHCELPLLRRQREQEAAHR